jgi:hypothetical protein
MSARATSRAVAKQVWARGRWTSLCALAYLALQLVLGAIPGDHGLLTPDGSVNLAIAALTLAALGLRLAWFFLLAPLLVYRLVAPEASPRRGPTSA